MNLTALFPLSRTKMDVLLEIYLNGEDYLRSLEKKTKVNPSLLHRLLRSLAAAGLLRREKKGREFYYALVSGQRTIKNLIENYHRDKIVQAAKELQLLFKLLSSNEQLIKKCSIIFLFGSWARGTATAESDIDLLFVTKEKKVVLSWCREASIAIGRTINPLVYSPQAWRSAIRKKEVFISSIVKNKRNRIILH